MSHENSFTNRVRQALKEIGAKKPVKVRDLDYRLELDYGTKYTRRLYSALGELVKMGDAVRTAPGEYRWQNRKKPPTIQERMWRALRALRVVALEDLQELAGAKRSYAEEFMQHLVKTGFCRKVGSGKQARWRLIKDPVKMPANKKKAKRLRRLRAKK